MRHEFKTMDDALAAGYRPVNRRRDTDISGPYSFGYKYENEQGEQTVTVWFSEEPNQMRQTPSFTPMYPPTERDPAEVEHRLCVPADAGDGLQDWFTTCSCGARWAVSYDDKNRIRWTPQNDAARTCPLGDE